MPPTSNTKTHGVVHQPTPSLSSLSDQSSHFSGTVASLSTAATSPISADFATGPLNLDRDVASSPKQTFDPEDFPPVKSARCKNIIKACRKGKPSELLVYEDVSASDFAYIANAVENDLLLKVKLDFFPSEHRLTITMPSSAHESLISCLTTSLSFAVKTMPFDGKHVRLSVYTNLRIRGRNISAEPDLQLRLSYASTIPALAKARSLWIVEAGFSQTGKEMLEKLRKLIADSPWAVLVCMIIIKEYPSYHAPEKGTACALKARKNAAIDEENWMAMHGLYPDIGPVIVDGYGWVNPSSIEIHVWVRPSKDTDIDVDNVSPTDYACGTLYPTESLGDIDVMFKRGLVLVRDAILDGMDVYMHDKRTGATFPENALDALRAWTPPSSFLDPTILTSTMGHGLWETAFDRYIEWHRSLRPLKAAGGARKGNSSTPCRRRRQTGTRTQGRK